MFKAQKLKTANDVAELLEDDSWYMSEKFDGRGMMTEYGADGRIRFYNLSGGEVNWRPGLRAHFLKELEAAGIVNSPFILQGELVRSPGGGYDKAEYRVFWTCHDFEIPLHSRIEEAKAIPGVLHHKYDLMHSLAFMVPWVNDPINKRDRFASLYAKGCEGVVFAHAEGLYQPGKRVSSVLKKKWIETADCAVTDFKQTCVDVNGYRHGFASISVVGESEDGSKIWVPHGAVHVRQRELDGLCKWGKFKAGDCGLLPYPILEVQYLYSTGIAFVQPIAKRVRFDKMRDTGTAYTMAEELRVSKLFQ